MKKHVSFHDIMTTVDLVSQVDAMNRKLKVRQNLMKSKNCTLYNISQDKVALSGFDLKRWIHDDNIHTRALGYRE